MPERSIRFGINDANGYRAATWKCWCLTGVGKNDVYLACRELKSELKVSMHETGCWHIAYSERFFESSVSDKSRQDKTRFVQRWDRPSEIATGFTLACRIITPWSSVTTPFDTSMKKNFFWIPNADHGYATEIAICITQYSSHISGWPTKDSMNTKLIGNFTLDNREAVWIVYRQIDVPKLADITGSLEFYRDKSREDLKSKHLRMFVYSDASDGSKVLHDCVIDTSNLKN